MAKFSRTSTAYADDGSVVAANVPRIMSSKGLLIEEGTTNLLPTSMQNRLANDSATNPLLFSIIDGLVQGGKYTISGKKRIFADDLCTNTRTTITFTYSDSTTESAWTPFNSLPKDGNFYDFTVTATANSAKTLTKVASAVFDYSSSTFMHQECQNVLLEQKPYATSFHPTTRAVERFTVPSWALNYQNSTIEFDYIPVNQPNNFTGQSNCPKILQIGTYYSNNSLTLWRFYDSATVSFYGRGDGATSWTIDKRATFTFNLNTKYHIAIRWTNANTFELFVDRVKLMTATSILNYASMGDIVLGDNVGSGGTNAIYSNLRISNKARSDAELANTGALTVDEWTTYFLPLNGNLGAQTAPRVISASGEGQTQQSRTGAGYRSMVTQDEVTTLLKRKAEFHPLIVASGEGLTEQSRIGSGYRTAVVQSSADVKLIEPSIEISTAVIERKCVTTVIERLSKTEVIGLPYVGDTVTLKAEFYTKGGVLADPENITLKLYDTLNKQIGTAVNIGSQHRISAGVYQYEYTVPAGYSTIFYEFAATQESTPQLIPGRISCKQRVDV